MDLILLPFHEMKRAFRCSDSLSGHFLQNRHEPQPMHVPVTVHVHLPQGADAQRRYVSGQVSLCQRINDPILAQKVITGLQLGHEKHAH